MTTHHKITIDGITYNILRCRTPASMADAGYINVAREMQTNGVAYIYDLQRPRGQKFYSAVCYNTGTFSKVRPTW